MHFSTQLILLPTKGYPVWGVSRITGNFRTPVLHGERSWAPSRSTMTTRESRNPEVCSMVLFSLQTNKFNPWERSSREKGQPVKLSFQLGSAQNWNLHFAVQKTKNPRVNLNFEIGGRLKGFSFSVKKRKKKKKTSGEFDSPLDVGNKSNACYYMLALSSKSYLLLLPLCTTLSTAPGGSTSDRAQRACQKEIHPF